MSPENVFAFDYYVRPTDDTATSAHTPQQTTLDEINQKITTPNILEEILFLNIFASAIRLEES